MNKSIKLILSSLISIVLIFSIPIYSKASTLESIISSGDSFLEIQDPGGTSALDEKKLKPLSDMVSGVLLTIAIAVTLISTVVMGINFVVQSVEDKAKIKESMVPWLIGIIIAFGAYGIWSVTIGILS